MKLRKGNQDHFRKKGKYLQNRECLKVDQKLSLWHSNIKKTNITLWLAWDNLVLIKSADYKRTEFNYRVPGFRYQSRSLNDDSNNNDRM